MQVYRSCSCREYHNRWPRCQSRACYSPLPSQGQLEVLGSLEVGHFLSPIRAATPSWQAKHLRFATGRNGRNKKYMWKYAREKWYMWWIVRFFRCFVWNEMILLATSSGARLDSCRREWTSACRSVTVAVRLLDPCMNRFLKPQMIEVMTCYTFQTSQCQSFTICKQVTNAVKLHVHSFWSKPKICRVLIHSHIASMTSLHKNTVVIFVAPWSLTFHPVAFDISWPTHAVLKRQEGEDSSMW